MIKLFQPIQVLYKIIKNKQIEIENGGTDRMCKLKSVHYGFSRFLGYHKNVSAINKSG